MNDPFKSATASEVAGRIEVEKINPENLSDSQFEILLASTPPNERKAKCFGISDPPNLRHRCSADRPAVAAPPAVDIDPPDLPHGKKPVDDPDVDRLIGRALTDLKVARKVVELPVEWFNENPAYRQIVETIRHQLQALGTDEPYELTRETLQDYWKPKITLNSTEFTPDNLAGLMITHSRVMFNACKDTEVRQSIDNIRDTHERKQITADLKAKKITPYEAKLKLREKVHGDHPRTDAGTADLFIDQFGIDIRYVAQREKWIVWDGKRWLLDETNVVAKKVLRFVQKTMPQLAGKIKNVEKRQHFLNYTARCQSRAAINNIQALAATKLSISANDLDTDKWLLCVENGTIDLQTGELREHRRGDLITKMSPASYDPQAKCPVWIAFLDKIFDGNTDLIEYIQRAVGYSLTGDISDQCFFILHGSGRNGKTTLIETIKFMMGEFSLTAMDSILLKYDRQSRNTDDEADLFGVRFAACSETNEGQRFDESKIKRLTGNRLITTMRKFESSITFPATHKIWLDTNHLPQITGIDIAMWRRIKTIPFKVTIPTAECDPHLPAKLRAENAGILAWAMEGLRRWKSSSLNINEPQEVREAVNAYRIDNDDFGQFLNDCVEDNDSEKVEKPKLYAAYTQWCEVNGVVKSKVLTSNALGRKLKDRGYQDVKTNGVQWIIGMSLRDLTSNASDTDFANDDPWDCNQKVKNTKTENDTRTF